MRTDRVLLPQSTSFSALTIFLRGCSLSSGATASSRSRNTTSAAASAAFLKSFGLLPGTASSLRCMSAGAGSPKVRIAQKSGEEGTRRQDGEVLGGGRKNEKKNQ